MKEYRSSVTIRSTPARVWSLLVDAPNYPRWNRTVDRVEGRVERGEKLTVYAKVSPGRGFPVRVAELDAPSRMVWRGGMPIGALFRGERTFSVTPLANGEVEFTMHEVFTGLLSPMILPSMPDLQPAFDEFAACLKEAAEV